MFYEIRQEDLWGSREEFFFFFFFFQWWRWVSILNHNPTFGEMCSRAVSQQPYNNHYYSPARRKFKLWSINEKHPFQLRCWRRLSGVPWTARRSNQSILKEINSEYSLEGLMLKLKCFGLLMQRANSSVKTQMLEKIEGRRRGQLRMKWLDGITDSVDMNLSKLWETVKEGKPGVLQSMASQSWTWLSDWTTTTYLKILRISTLMVLQNNSFYTGAFLQKAVLWMEGKLWRNASKGRSDPSEPLS